MIDVIVCHCGHARDRHDSGCVDCDCEGYRPGVAQAGDPRAPAQGKWTLMPTPQGTCGQCAVDHEPDQPHNKQSLAYQYHFYSEHGRWPTWADAIAHCDAEMQAHWRAALKDKGVDVDG